MDEEQDGQGIFFLDVWKKKKKRKNIYLYSYTEWHFEPEYIINTHRKTQKNVFRTNFKV